MGTKGLTRPVWVRKLTVLSFTENFDSRFGSKIITPIGCVVVPIRRGLEKHYFEKLEFHLKSPLYSNYTHSKDGELYVEKKDDVIVIRH